MLDLKQHKHRLDMVMLDLKQTQRWFQNYQINPKKGIMWILMCLYLTCWHLSVLWFLSIDSLGVLFVYLWRHSRPAVSVWFLCLSVVNTHWCKVAELSSRIPEGLFQTWHNEIHVCVNCQWHYTLLHAPPLVYIEAIHDWKTNNNLCKKSRCHNQPSAEL